MLGQRILDAMNIEFQEPSRFTKVVEFRMFQEMVDLKTGYDLAKAYGQRQAAAYCLNEYRKYYKFFSKEWVNDQ